VAQSLPVIPGLRYRVDLVLDGTDRQIPDVLGRVSPATSYGAMLYQPVNGCVLVDTTPTVYIKDALGPIRSEPFCGGFFAREEIRAYAITGALQQYPSAHPCDFVVPHTARAVHLEISGAFEFLHRAAMDTAENPITGNAAIAVGGGKESPFTSRYAVRHVIDGMKFSEPQQFVVPFTEGTISVGTTMERTHLRLRILGYFLDDPFGDGR
jgi:hypothetical protein